MKHEFKELLDPKIWATMSSASSKNRANGAVDVKPMRRDDSEVLLQNMSPVF